MSASSEEPEAPQPGLGELREAVASRLRQHLPGRPPRPRDGIAGLNSAISNLPDGMANAVLVGVSPAHGLYAAMLGPTVGGLFSSTSLMMITTTAAASLTTSQALAGQSGEARAEALFLMVVLIGGFQILFGLLRLGRLLHFVSSSVMAGFLTGVAVLLILSQLPTVTGYQATGSNRVTQTLDLLTHLGQISLLSVSMAVLTLALAVVLPRTRLGNLGRLVAIVVPSVLVALFATESVRVVHDVGEIPGGVPLPALPSLSSFSFEVLTGAFAVALVILVQGAGVSQSVPNPDGSRSDASRDFVAQGAANVACGFFRGLPVGGSASATALTVLYGGATRWSVVLAGLWLAAIAAVFPHVVGYIAMPALGALLILAGVRSVKVEELVSIWNAGWPSRVAATTTFLAMLFLPIQGAVGIGVALSALLFLYGSSTDVSVVELVELPDGRIEEHPVPRHLPSGRITVLDVYGHLFFAGARTLERQLPSPEGARNPVVILRLRGRTRLGATLINVLAAYADRLSEVEGRLYLTGLNRRFHDDVLRAVKLRPSSVRAYRGTPVRGEATRDAIADARAWLSQQPPDAAAGDAPPGEAGSEDTLQRDHAA